MKRCTPHSFFCDNGDNVYDVEKKMRKKGYRLATLDELLKWNAAGFLNDLKEGETVIAFENDYNSKMFMSKGGKRFYLDSNGVIRTESTTLWLAIRTD